AATLEQGIKGMHGRQQSDVCVLSRSKKISDFRDCRYAGQTRNEMTPTLQRGKNTSLERIVSEEPVEECRDSTDHLKKSPNGERANERIVEEPIDLTRKTKNLDVSRGIEGTIEMERTRSYAQMIASYNDAMYEPNCSGVLKDNSNSSMIKGIHKSPFTTASLVSPKWRNKPKGSRDTNSSASGLNETFNRDVKFNNASCATHIHCRYDDDNRDDDVIENNNEAQKSLSYASMIERYSKAIDLSLVDSCGRHGNMLPKRYVSTKFDEIPIILTSEKDANKKPNVTADDAKEKVGDDQAEVEKNAQSEETKMDETIEDLKRITAKADSGDKWMLQSAYEPAYWLDRVMNAHKKRIKNRRETFEKTSVKATANELANPDTKPDTIVQADETISNSETESTMASQRSWRHHSTKPPASIPPASKPPSQDGPGGRSSNPIVDYIRRGPVSTSRAAPTNPIKEPQIELRMTPSQNESVVSINMDEEAVKAAGGSKEQLSVVISSRRDATGRAEPRPDFSSMQISISETTIPVKQIEFSINGKPVSELKSIIARADRLDVLSSMDKVEIRIPSRSPNTATERSTNVVATSSSSSKPVLNLQIAAKFNEPRFEQPRDAEMKTDPSHMPPPTAPVTPTPPTPPAPPVKPPRPHNLFMREATESGVTTNQDVSGTTNASRDVATAKQVENSISQRSVGASSTPGEEKISKIVSPNEAVFQNDGNTRSNSDENASSRQPQQPAMNNEDKNRTPSNAIPWWSSEDSFKKIKKKGNTPKGALESNDTVALIPVQDSPSVKDEEKLTTDSSKVDPTKVDTRRSRDIVPKKPVVEEKKRDHPDPIVNYVRAKSSPRWVPVKHASETTTTRPRDSSGVLKGPRYRVRSNLHGREVTEKDSDMPTISRVRCAPKVVKSVPAIPRDANSGARSVVESQNMENLKPVAKANAKIEKPVAVRGPGSQIGKANVQNSNTIYKKEGELSANESADVSAKGEKKRSDTDGAVEKNLLVKPIDEDPRIKEILKSMKPIEKREDGTLIDYGVIVPSRKPSGKVTEIPRIQAKASDGNTVTKELVQSREKIVEPEKIRSVNKLASKFDAANIEIKHETNKPRTLTSEKAMNEEKKKKVLSNFKKDDFIKKEENRTESASNRDRLHKRLISAEIPAESSVEGTRSNNEPLKTVQKSGDTNVKSSLLDKSKNTLPGSSVTPDETKASEKKEPKSTLKSVEQKKASLETTIGGPSKISDETASNVPLMGTINFPGSQKSGGDAVKSDNTFSKELPTGGSRQKHRKNTNDTGVSPFKGTIQLRPSDNLVRLTDIDKEKVNPELVDQGDNSAKPNVTKKPSNKGGGGTGSNSPAAISTKPTKLSTGSNDSEPPTSHLKETSGQSIVTEDKNGKKVGSYEKERPEK
ncbi:unnamed protein product, partial [Heterotrigona itama]